MNQPQEQRLSFKQKIGIFLGIFLLLLCIIISYSHFIGTTGLIIKEYKITNSNIPNSFYGFKIVHISDIHFGRTIKEKELKKIVNQINLLKPDIIVLTGDLLDEKTNLSSNQIKQIQKLLSNMKVTIGKFAITGENDYKQKEWSTIIKNSGFINLNDTYELIYKDDYEPILLAGLSSNLKGTKKAKDKIEPINQYIESIKDSDEISIPHYKILLMHEPDFVNDINYKNYNLILAGHSHNGQVKIPFIGSLLKPKGAKIYNEVYYKLNHTNFYISSGLGTSKYDFRLFNRPSINFYRLVNK